MKHPDPLPDRQRCFGSGPGKEFYADYHDNEWGVPVHSDHKLFEFLILEGAQAGLNWELILRKRDGYQRAFKNFDVAIVASMTDSELEALRQNPEIVRNRLKIYSARHNAIAFIKIQEEFGSFDRYIWDFVGGAPLVGGWNDFSEVPATTPVSDAISKDLKKRGMAFVGSTIIYAYMQAVGLVNDHVASCWKFADRSRAST